MFVTMLFTRFTMLTTKEYVKRRMSRPITAEKPMAAPVEAET